MTDEQTPAEDIDPILADAAADEIVALKSEVAALKDQALRYAAEAENTRRRAERESNDARAYAIQKFGRDLLGVADNLARAMAAAPRDHADSNVANFVTGVEMTEKALQDAFANNGLKRVDPAKGDRFDPHQHQAMMEQPSEEVAAGGVIQTLQTGYELYGRIVRPAMVVVAAKGSTGPAAPEAPVNPYAANEDGGEGGSVDTRA
ncbi:MAG: nucleotide exchange factor GrpE [Caulobacteraceae bacterium]|nr:nucleotide exchange factor GrpE [Caulobacteraceae bacterium]